MANTQPQHLSPRVSNLLLGVAIVILMASVVVRYATAAPQDAVLILMGIGVFLFMLVAFDQPD